MIKRFKSVTFESIFFYLCLGVSLSAIIFNRVNPTIDGPSHLYNAKIIDYLFSGNAFISKYYALNKIPVANITDHYLLALFMGIFSWEVAEKLLIVLYLLSFSLLFRMLIKQWNKKDISLSIFAIPFSFPFMYYIGFYNFCLSFPLLFGIIIYYVKHCTGEIHNPSFKNYFILCLLTTLLYFTNGLAFLFSGLVLFLFELSVWKRLLGNKSKPGILLLFKKMLQFFLVWLPGIVCFIVFLSETIFFSGTRRVPFNDLIRWIYVVRPLVIYPGPEDTLTKSIFCLIGIALLGVIYSRFKRGNKTKWHPYDFFLLISTLAFCCYLVIPDEASVGMMSMRLSYYSFIFLLIWITVQPISKIITWTISILLMMFHFTLLFEYHQPVISALNNKEEIVINAGKCIKPNSVVLTVDVTGNWLLNHFSDYLALDKPLIILPNYESDDAWFAVNYNYKTMPMLFFGDKDAVLPYLIKHKVSSDETKAIDYVFIYGDYGKIMQDNDWKTILQKEYKPEYISTDGRIHIFSLKVNNLPYK